jgi:DNA gyrase subunit A
MGRATQGVRLIKLDEGDAIAAVAKVEVEEETDLGINDESSVNGESSGTNNTEPESNGEEKALPGEN